MRTYTVSRTEPREHPQDAMGRRLNAGDVVIFHGGQGTLSKGTVLEIKKFHFKKSRPATNGEYWWHLICAIRIVTTDSALEVGNNPGHVTTIGNPNGIWKLN